MPHKQVTLARSIIDQRCHVCAFFHSREDEYKVMLPFLKEGLDASEKVFQIMDGEQREERLGHLKDAGVDATTAERNEMLEVHAWENAYLAGGRFDQHAMIALIEDLAKDSSLWCDAVVGEHGMGAAGLPRCARDPGIRVAAQLFPAKL